MERLFGGSGPATLGGGLGSSSGYLMPVFVGFVGLLMILMVIYVIVQTYKGRPATTLTGPTDLWAPTNPVVVDRTTVRNQMAGSYTLSTFFKIDAVPDMRSAATQLLTLPSVWNLNYDPAAEALVFQFQETAKPATEVRVPGFALQRWNQLTLTLEGRSIDIYVNGALTKSALLENVPPSGNSSVTIVPGNVMGSVALAQIWSRRLTVSEVTANYASTADSQGRPFLGAALLAPLKNISTLPDIFCPGGDCKTATPTASPSQTWEFPYA
jgi:hypothetical protein